MNITLNTNSGIHIFWQFLCVTFFNLYTAFNLSTHCEYSVQYQNTFKIRCWASAIFTYLLILAMPVSRTHMCVICSLLFRSTFIYYYIKKWHTRGCIPIHTLNFTSISIKDYNSLHIPISILTTREDLKVAIILVSVKSNLDLEIPVLT